MLNGSTTQAEDRILAPGGDNQDSGAQAAEAELDLVALLESLLFVSQEPAPVARLAEALGVDEAAIEQAARILAEIYEQRGRGLRLQQKQDRLQLVTSPQAAPFVERFLGLDLSSRLSAAALETLAVIAYRQPITRTGIEAIRGVNCDGVMRTLLARGLVEPVGRLEQAGRPILYGTTFQFLQYFGLSNLEALPPLPGDDAQREDDESA